MTRLWKNGLPWDACLLTRSYLAMWAWFPGYSRWKLERDLNARFDHALYGIVPKHHVDQQQITVSDELPHRLLSGRIKVKPEVTKLTPKGVLFADGTFEDNIDVILHGTGYHIAFPCVDESITKADEGNHVQLYRYVFPPNLQHPTLAIIGCVQPEGSPFGIIEMQARWTSKIFKVSKPTMNAEKSY